MKDGISSNRKHELCKKMDSNLATLRTKTNVKQDELADRLGFSRQTISAIETGKRDMQWSTFTAIALFFSRNPKIRS
jgi:DNA-binding XRE family transcriptional regulator